MIKINKKNIRGNYIMRLPNGYGSVYKLPGKRRRPWAAVKTIGFDENGKQKRQFIGYAATKEEALGILAEYNNKPWDVNKQKMTFSDVYELWLKNESQNLAKNTVRSYISKYKNYCQSLYDIPYKDLRAFHFENVINNSGKSNGTKNVIRRLFRVLDATAYKYEVIDKQYTELVKSKKEETAERKPFTEEEIEILWNHKNDQYVDTVLILLYTGLRRNEFVSLTIEDVDLNQETIIIRKSKTEAGKRIVPIHHKIIPLIENLVENAKNGKLIHYSSNSFSEHFRICLLNLGIKHIPHECRHTLSTRLDNAGVNRKIINLILGHRSSGVGERVYTHKTLDQLKEAINSID